MKPDLYTKAVLTVIAILLAVIAFRPFVGPNTLASAQRSFNKVRNSQGKISILWAAYHKR